MAATVLTTNSIITGHHQHKNQCLNCAELLDGNTILANTSQLCTSRKHTRHGNAVVTMMSNLIVRSCRCAGCTVRVALCHSTQSARNRSVRFEHISRKSAAAAYVVCVLMFGPPCRWPMVKIISQLFVCFAGLFSTSMRSNPIRYDPIVANMCAMHRCISCWNFVFVPSTSRRCGNHRHRNRRHQFITVNSPARIQTDAANVSVAPASVVQICGCGLFSVNHNATAATATPNL